MEYPSKSRNGRRDDSHASKDSLDGDVPPMSRLFIICNKSHTEEDFHEAFSTFGKIEDVWMVKNKRTQENKGIAYVKFAKTSDAAKAQELMNGKTIGKSNRALKILVASNRNEGSNKQENDHEKLVRLFIVISKQATEDEIRNEFSQYGVVEDVTILKDRTTGNPKGFGYVRFAKFYHAAIAFEKCLPKFKAVFAEAKGASYVKRVQSNRLGDDSSVNSSSGNSNSYYNGGYSSDCTEFSYNSETTACVRMENMGVSLPTCLEVVISNQVNQDQLWRLFDIIPGLDYCQISRESSVRPKTNEVIVVYDNPESAIYAKDKLQGLEYPTGERIIVKLTKMSSAEMDTPCIDERLNKDSICNVQLPPAHNLAPPGSVVVQRLFIVLAANLPQLILKTVFSCWKGLIDVYLLPKKKCGYVRYADKDSAQEAIKVLNGAEIYGTKIKVMEAIERGLPDDDDKGM